MFCDLFLIFVKIVHRFESRLYLEVLMKSLNILSVIYARRDFSKELFENYMKNFGTSFKGNELIDLENFIKYMKPFINDISILDNYFFGFTIKQISKEFDLLRFGENEIINIELKSKDTGIRIGQQLIKNRYYLKFLGKKVYNFSYISELNKLFYLTENDKIEEVEITFLISILEEQEIEKIDFIENLFNPTNYLVSPFNSTETFINGEYFLTDQQIRIKKELHEINCKNASSHIAITGGAGTGKTLLVYDIAKDYIEKGLSIFIIHCGKLNSGHLNLISNYFWPISSIKQFEVESLDEIDILIIDEIQRIRKYQLTNIFEKLKNRKIKCIYSFDPLQCMDKTEITNNIPEYIRSQVNLKEFKLADKIRSNKEISNFIKRFLNKSKKIENETFSNVHIQYFSNVDFTKTYLESLSNEGWKVINYTPSQYQNFPYDKFRCIKEDCAHEVIGQEFDKVVAVVDEFYYYNDVGTLSTYGWRERPYYHPTKMLFQILTRTRKELMLVIINNKVVLERVLDVLNNGKGDK